ncbi:DNA (cytosine-5-)-methyltransferase, partial [Euryarchaeota archaeon]|nr:DNA (cytosine-5-)-methyltransferase [Euryarchaeota archaeon]
MIKPLTISVSTPPIRVAELFAGVGGFRLGLEGEDYEFVFSNQWEPDETKQWASKIYVKHFGEEGHSNEDIHKIRKHVPEHDLLVGGFPCQDYSVARTISGEMGIKGEKGKLWTPIKQIIRDAPIRPKVILLENVPRLINSPSNHRGLNFAVILSDLLKMGYDVEWRVVQASDYGMPQKRNRVFMIAYRRPNKTNYYRNGKGTFGPKKRTRNPMIRWMTGTLSSGGNDEWEIGPFASSFPLIGEFPIRKSEVPSVSEFSWNKKNSPFGSAGYAWKDNKKVAKKWMWTFKTIPIYEGKFTKIRDILVKKHDSNYEIVDDEKLRMYRYIKGEQKEWRIRKEDADKAREIEGDLWELYQKCTKGYHKELWTNSRKDSRYLKGLERGLIYDYTAGKMSFPDSLDGPSRTVVTAEVGKSV